jgi:hypothetical protein
VVDGGRPTRSRLQVHPSRDPRWTPNRLLHCLWPLVWPEAAPRGASEAPFRTIQDLAVLGSLQGPSPAAAEYIHSPGASGVAEAVLMHVDWDRTECGKSHCPAPFSEALLVAAVASASWVWSISGWLINGVAFWWSVRLPLAPLLHQDACAITCADALAEGTQDLLHTSELGCQRLAALKS